MFEPISPTSRHPAAGVESGSTPTRALDLPLESLWPGENEQYPHIRISICKRRRLTTHSRSELFFLLKGTTIHRSCGMHCASGAKENWSRYKRSSKSSFNLWEKEKENKSEFRRTGELHRNEPTCERFACPSQKQRLCLSCLDSWSRSESPSSGSMRSIMRCTSSVTLRQGCMAS